MIRSHGPKILAIACCCSAAIASAFHATRALSAPHPQEPAAAPPVFVAQHDLLGIDVRGPAVVGAEAPVRGTIADLVVDAQTGLLREAVILLPKPADGEEADGGAAANTAPRKVAIPWARLARDPATGSVTTAMGDAELAALPAFEPAARGLREKAAVEASSERAKEPAVGTADKGSATPAAAAGAPATLLASECGGLPVFGRVLRLGACRELVFEQRTGMAAFAIVARADAAGAEQRWALPWAALAVQKAGREIPAHLRIDRTVEELAGAPQLAAGLDDLTRQPVRQEIYTFHRVAVPPYDVRVDLKAKVAPTAGRDRR